MVASESQLILQLQLLIARAGQSDSLRWWEDDVLTAAGQDVAERLFPYRPIEARLKLALASATARHNASVRGGRPAVHLYRLDMREAVLVELEKIPVAKLSVPEAPITTLEDLRAQMEALLREPLTRPRMREEHQMGAREVIVAASSRPTHPLELAKLFASAYLAAEPEQPVFPFLFV